MPVVVDVREEQSVAEMVDATVRELGRLDVLNNNAADHSNIGASDSSATSALTYGIASWWRISVVSCWAASMQCRRCFAMRKVRGGAIINTSSIGGLSGHVTNAAYGTAKAGILMLTKYVATMYGRRGIRSCDRSGLFIKPETMGNFSDEFLGISRSERLLERCGTPDDIATTTVFLHLTKRDISLVRRSSWTVGSWPTGPRTPSGHGDPRMRMDEGEG